MIYNSIIDPITNLPIDTCSNKGKKIINKYIQMLGGGIPDQTLIYNKIINIHTTIQRLEKQMKNLENKF